MHLFFNAFTFYFFGRAVEEIFVALFPGKGLLFFVLLFLLGVVVSDIPTFLKHRHNPGYNSLGASGGVSAVVFAYILFMPTAKLMLIFLPIPIPGFILGALYLIYSYYQSKNSTDHINHDAHLYGALFGLVYCTILEPRIIPRFFQELSQGSLF
jgi:membrane associated rhomboid family serine protease